MPPLQCPDGKYANEGSIYLTDCGDSGNVYMGTFACILLVFLLMIFCIYCILDWCQFQGAYQVVQLHRPGDVECPPSPHRCRPAPSAPGFVYYEESNRCCHGGGPNVARPYPVLVQAPARAAMWS